MIFAGIYGYVGDLAQKQQIESMNSKHLQQHMDNMNNKYLLQQQVKHLKLEILLACQPSFIDEEENAFRYFLNISRTEAARSLRFSSFEREMWE